MRIWRRWKPAGWGCRAPVPAGVTARSPCALACRHLDLTHPVLCGGGEQETSQGSRWFVRCGLWPDPEGTRKM